MGLVNLIIKLGLDRSAISRGIKQGTMEWEQGQQKMAVASARFTTALTRAWLVAIPAAMTAGIKSAFTSILRLKDEADAAGLTPTELIKAQMMAAQSGKTFANWQQHMGALGITTRQAISGGGPDGGIGKGVQAASDIRSGFSQVVIRSKATLAAMLGDLMDRLPEAAPLKKLMRSGERGRNASLLQEFNAPTNPVFNNGMGVDSDKSEDYLREIRDAMVKIERARVANTPGQFP